jgi:hypothetical protein
MFKNYEIDTDFGMDSPISLNSIENLEQFRTFSHEETNKSKYKNKKRKVPVLNIKLKNLIDQKEITVVSMNFHSAKQKENIGNCAAVRKNPKYAVIKNAKELIRTSRSPFGDKNTAKPSGTVYKSLSPFQRTLSRNVNNYAMPKRS